jgi:hypothetical protein
MTWLNPRLAVPKIAISDLPSSLATREREVRKRGHAGPRLLTAERERREPERKRAEPERRVGSRRRKRGHAGPLIPNERRNFPIEHRKKGPA